MHSAEIRIEIIEEPLRIDPVVLEQPGRDGAVVEFRGIVRGLEGTASISAIDYECHLAMARVQLERIAHRMAEIHRLSALWIYHRIGVVPVGETSLYVRAVAPHREAAFRATQELIENLKRDVPIWKHPLATG